MLRSYPVSAARMHKSTTAIAVSSSRFLFIWTHSLDNNKRDTDLFVWEFYQTQELCWHFDVQKRVHLQMRIVIIGTECHLGRVFKLHASPYYCCPQEATWSTFWNWTDLVVVVLWLSTETDRPVNQSPLDPGGECIQLLEHTKVLETV